MPKQKSLLKSEVRLALDSTDIAITEDRFGRPHQKRWCAHRISTTAADRATHCGVNPTEALFSLLDYEELRDAE